VSPSCRHERMSQPLQDDIVSGAPSTSMVISTRGESQVAQRAAGFGTRPPIGHSPRRVEPSTPYWARRPTTAVMLKATWAQMAGPNRPVRTVSTAAMAPKPMRAGRS
jgi:hypothetical protein